VADRGEHLTDAKIAAMVIWGSCHCGNIAFALDWTPEPTEIPARACDCTFCTKHGGVWTSCPAGSLRVTIKQPSLVSNYRFGTGTADFHICTRCGIVPLVTSRVEGRLFAVVNVNTFENVDPALLRKDSASLDGEDEATRLGRRQRNWIGEVEISNAV